jgi:ABC-type glycerol-3-phosphate transport system substrate-binding protein
VSGVAATVAVLALAGCGAGGTNSSIGTQTTNAPTAAATTDAATAATTSADSTTTDATAPASGGNLTIVVEGGGHAELQPIADAFTAKTGTTVTFVELPYSGLYDRISSELSSGNVSFDIAAVDAVWISAFKDGLAPIDDLFTDAVKADMFPSLLNEAQAGGHFIGMPAWTNAELLFYRTDLFNDPANQTAFKAKYGYDLAAPATWQQYLDIANFFTAQSAAANGGTPKLYGADVKGAVETEWLATVLQAGSPTMVLDKDGNVIINDAAHKAALDFYTRLATVDNAAPAGAAQIDWGAAQNLFNQGSLAMTRFWAHAYTQIPTDSPVYGKVGVTPMPAGPGGIAATPGAWYLSVPTVGKQNDMAKQFIAFAAANNAMSLNTSLGLAATKSALESMAGKPGHENLQPLIDTLNAPATAPRPAVAQWQQIVDSVLIPMLQKAVTPGQDNQALLDDAKTQIEAILGK